MPPLQWNKLMPSIGARWRRFAIGQRHGPIAESRPSSTAASPVKPDKARSPAGVPRDTSHPGQYPLSAMPTGMLLRSLFVSTISSNKFLLIPSLHLLSFFAHPGRSFLFNVDRNPVLHGLLKKTFYNQFCAGETDQETKQCVRGLKDLGFRGVILTFAKEVTFDHRTKASHRLSNTPKEEEKDSKAPTAFDADIEAWRVGTLQTAALIGEGDILAIKMTGAGPAVTSAFTSASLPPAQMLAALSEIASTCQTRGIQIIVDAESQHFQHGIALTALDLMRTFNRPSHPPVIYNTYQAYLKSTPALVAAHLAAAADEGFALGLKLVRGAYMLSDDRRLMHDSKADTDAAYDAMARGALCRRIGAFGSARAFPAVHLFLASHNRESVVAARRLQLERLERGLETVPLAFGQLHGMSDEVSFSLLRERGADGAAPDVYKCTTWGSMGECIGYLLRRAVENRDAVLRTREEFLALRGEVGRRIRGRFLG